MDAPVMPIKAIKKILIDELNEFKCTAEEALHAQNIWANSVSFKMLNIAYDTLVDKLIHCDTYDELDDYVYFAGYHMSLEEWVNSL